MPSHSEVLEQVRRAIEEASQVFARLTAGVIQACELLSQEIEATVERKTWGAAGIHSARQVGTGRLRRKLQQPIAW